MQSQILRTNLRTMAALATVLFAAGVLALALLTTHGPVAPVSPPAVPAAPTVTHVPPAMSANPDANLPICRRHGGPAC